MLKFSIFYIILNLSFILFINAAKKVICDSNKTVIANFSMDELIFFESFDYPKSLINDCEITFILENYEYRNNSRVMFMLTNGNYFLRDIQLSSNNIPIVLHGDSASIHISNYTEITAKFSNIENVYFAFQGMIVSDDWSGGTVCEYESITNIDPFIFKDETEIFYIDFPFYDPSDIDNLQIGGRCVWKFLAPKSYNFKLVVAGINENLTMELIYGNSQHAVVKYNPEIDFQYYNLEGPLLQIFHSYPSYENSVFAFAEFYLTITKIGVPHVHADCRVTKNEKEIIWEIQNGYPNNAKCQYNLSLPIQNAYIATINNLQNEHGFDALKFYYDNKIINIVSKNDIYIFQSNINGYNGFVLWKFISDGSVAQQGFSVKFKQIECTCNNMQPIIVPCYKEYHLQLMNPKISDIYYCGNMNCKYEISIDPICSDKTTFIKIEKDDNFIDEFKLTSNGTIILHSKGPSNNTIFTSFLSPNNNITFQLISVPSIISRYLDVSFTAMDSPLMFKKMILTAENPEYFFEIQRLPPNTYFLVELDDALIQKNDTIEIFSNLANGETDFLMFYSSLYDKEIYLPSDTKYLEISSHIFNISSFYVYKQIDADDFREVFGTLLIRAKNAYSSGCIFNENIFDSYYAAENNRYISMVSKENETCEIILLNRVVWLDDGELFGDEKIHAFSYFWTNSNEYNVKIFSNSIYNEMEFNATTINPWNIVILTSPSYTIKIPPNSSLLIQFDNFPSNILQLSYPFKVLWGTPYYGILDNVVINSNDNMGVFHIPMNLIANVKILEFNVSKTGYFCFLMNIENRSDDPQCVTSVEQTFQFFNSQNSNIKITYDEDEIGYTGVLFEIETTLKN